MTQKIRLADASNKADLSLGKCCCCETDTNVRTVLQLQYKTPIEGRGWGCMVCNIRLDGATAVVCDDCYRLMLQDKAQLKFACRGYPESDGRIPIHRLTIPFDHNWMFHESEEAKG